MGAGHVLGGPRVGQLGLSRSAVEELRAGYYFPGRTRVGETQALPIPALGRGQVPQGQQHHCLHDHFTPTTHVFIGQRYFPEANVLSGAPVEGW